MKKYYLDYPLVQGYIHNWLAVGSLPYRLGDNPPAGESFEEFRRRILVERTPSAPIMPKPPVELDKITLDGEDYFWDTAHAKDDHLFERNTTNPVWTYQQAWGFNRLVCPGLSKVEANITASCPVTLWLNGEKIYHSEVFSPLNSLQFTSGNVSIRLKKGPNNLFILLEDVQLGDAVLSGSVQISGEGLDSIEVHIPVLTSYTSHRKAVEQMFACAYMNRAVYHRDDPVSVHVLDDLPGTAQAAIRLQRPPGWIYGETYETLKGGAVINCLYAIQLPSGNMQAQFLPPPENYYHNKFRASRIVPFQVANYPFYETPQNTYEERLIGLSHELVRLGGVYAENARMTLGWWDTIDAEEIRKVIRRINRREVGCLKDLMGLIGMVSRYGKHKKFPQDLIPEIERCITEFPYAQGDLRGLEYSSEADHILLFACRVLAGQKYSKVVFTASGLTGQKERNQGEKIAHEWLLKRCQSGFCEWDSNFEELLIAISHLVDLAHSDELRELAVVLLDKLVFSLGVNSLKGCFGSSQAFAPTTFLKSARFHPAASLMYLLWGTGNYNDNLAGAFSLGAAKNYALPALLEQIALDQREEVWGMERHRCQGVEGDGDETNKVVYKTPDNLLISVQDYHPGKVGKNELIWRATLSPEAVVFTSHPGGFNQADGRQKGYWSGNASLPRVAQWKDRLICMYNAPANEGLDFTHAYFPCYAFDEYQIEDGWAFARKGDAYLALYAAPGLTLHRYGDDAYRELRSEGRQSVWLIQLGRAALDESFDAFKEKIHSKDARIDGLNVNWETIRDEQLEFGWNGPLKINGKEQPITGFKHYDYPYAIADLPAEKMDIGIGDQIMRLSFH